MFDNAYFAGTHAITATYTGDENYAEASAAIDLPVAKALPHLALSGTPTPAPFTATVQMKVSFSAPVWYGVSGATGNIVLRDGDTVLLELPLANSQLSFENLTKGSHVISAEYAGDANFEPVSVTYTQEITKPVPFVEVTLTPATNLIAGSTVTIDAVLSHSLGTSGISGTLSLLVDDAVVATAPVINAGAQFQTSFTTGSHTILVSYSGDDTWAASWAQRSVFAYLPAGSVPPVIATVDIFDVSIRWQPVLGASSYTVWFKTSLGSPWQTYATTTQTTLNAAYPPETTRLFAVTVTDTNGNVSAMGPPDLATSVGFSEPTLLAAVTPVRAIHLNELRAVIQRVRTFAGLGPYPYTNTIAAGQRIRAADVAEMRTAIAAARATIGVPAIVFTDPSLTPGVSVIRAAHFRELRAGGD